MAIVNGGPILTTEPSFLGWSSKPAASVDAHQEALDLYANLRYDSWRGGGWREVSKKKSLSWGFVNYVTSIGEV